MPTFTVKINLGNDAMRTAGDLNEILHKIAYEVLDPREAAPFAETDEDGNLVGGWYQTILDRNGNDVGRYAVKDADAE